MAGEDPDYLERVRRMRCCAPAICHATQCQAHHPRVGVVGLAQRGHDDTAIPLCPEHHRALHDLSGAFAGWPGVVLRDWQLEMIDEIRALVLLARCTEEPVAVDEEDIPF